MPQNGGYICQWRASCFEDLPPVEFMYLVLLACYVRVTIGDSDFCLPLIFSDQTGEGKLDGSEKNGGSSVGLPPSHIASGGIALW